MAQTSSEKLVSTGWISVEKGERPKELAGSVQNSPPRSPDLYETFLLPNRQPLIFAMFDDLQLDQPQQNQHDPNKAQSEQDIDAFLGERVHS